MPEDACQFFYKRGDEAEKGCVFCSYGDAKCPTAQRNTGGCRRMAIRPGFMVCGLNDRWQRDSRLSRSCNPLSGATLQMQVDSPLRDIRMYLMRSMRNRSVT